MPSTLPVTPIPGFRRVLRWLHMTCGLVIALYAVVIGLTGSILVFHDELSALVRPELHRFPAEPQPFLLTSDDALAVAQKSLPGWQPISLTWPNAETPHWMVYMLRGPDAREVYVETASGTLAGVHNPGVGADSDWLGWVGRLHVSLLSGSVGRTLNGIGAWLLLGMTLSGIVVWWPSGSSTGLATRLRGRFRVDFPHGRSATEWRRFVWQLHQVVGSVSLMFVLLVAFTGTYYVWLPNYIKLLDRFFTRSVDPKISRSTTPQTGKSPVKRMEELARIAQQQLPDRPLFRASIPVPGQPVRITLLEGRPQQFHRVSSVALDPVTGAVLQRSAFDQRPTGNSILTWFSVLHFGRFGGDGIGFLLVKALWSLLALSLPVLAVTGFWMWWKRVMRR
ncbi:MAG: PepSY-associated TM helix domain-containing protein [Acidobacteriota bacterium]